MRDRLDEFGEGVDLALVTFAAAEYVEAYQEEHELPFPILLDPDRATYRSYGLGRGPVARVWGWRMVREYVRILRRSGLGRLQRSTEDTLQLGGDFVVAPDGTLAWAFWGAGPDDRPTVETLLTAVQATQPPNA